MNSTLLNAPAAAKSSALFRLQPHPLQLQHVLYERKGSTGNNRARALCGSCLLALGIVLASPVAAYAIERSHAPVLGHRAIHHRAVVYHDTTFVRRGLAARAEAPVGARPWRDPYKPSETDGLSRDPDACASYGCVDSGG